MCSVAQTCPILWDPMDCRLPGSSVYGIFKARMLEQVAFADSRELSQLRDWTHVSCVSFICRWILYYLAPPGKSIFLIVVRYQMHICRFLPVCGLFSHSLTLFFTQQRFLFYWNLVYIFFLSFIYHANFLCLKSYYYIHSHIGIILCYLLRYLQFYFLYLVLWSILNEFLWRM